MPRKGAFPKYMVPKFTNADWEPGGGGKVTFVFLSFLLSIIRFSYLAHYLFFPSEGGVANGTPHAEEVIHTICQVKWRQNSETIIFPLQLTKECTNI